MNKCINEKIVVIEEWMDEQRKKLTSEYINECWKSKHFDIWIIEWMNSPIK